jgi:hypothetical protein
MTPQSYIDIGASISKSIPMEFFSNANFLEAISIEQNETVEEQLLKNEVLYENEIKLNEYLPLIENGLYEMWQGAVEAYSSKHHDKIRHFAVSLRELLTHLLHILAPNDEVNLWTNDPQMFHKGQPTRNCRLSYICRNILMVL